LNIYGFQRVHHGPHKGGYTHKYCVQCYPDLCEQIKRESTPPAFKEAFDNELTQQRGRLKRVISWDAATLTAASQQAHQEQQKEETKFVINGFAWDVQAEEALEDVTTDEFVPYSHHRTVTSMSNVAQALNPFPMVASTGNNNINASNVFKGPPLGTKDSVLNEDDIAFFKNLFQPGDVAEEKQLFDNFFLGNEPPQMPPALATTNYQTEANVTTPLVAPLLVSGAVSEYNFPRKLYRLLEDAETNPAYQAIVSWNMDGKAFKVHCKKRFVELILPNYFDQTQYASFRRQLNMYSYQRVSIGTYTNPFFMRGRKDLLDKVVRKSGSSNKGN
jgi:hypothetical protein